MIPTVIDLPYTNMGMGACLIDGLVCPSIDGMFDLCGTTIMYEWDFTDFCGNNINHIQTIEVLPADEAVFVNPPADLVLNCEDPIPAADPLFYTNNESAYR